jgi:hypothetical protein
MDLKANANSGAVWREVPKEHVAVETDRGPNKRNSGRNLAAERRRKPKDGSTEGRHSVKEWHDVRKRHRKNQMRGSSKRRTFGRRHQPKPKCINGTRNRDLRQQL